MKSANGENFNTPQEDQRDQNTEGTDIQNNLQNMDQLSLRL